MSEQDEKAARYSGYKAVQDQLRNNRVEELYRYRTNESMPLPYFDLASAYVRYYDSKDPKKSKEFRNMGALEQTRTIADELGSNNSVLRNPENIEYFSPNAKNILRANKANLNKVFGSSINYVQNREARLSTDKALAATQKIKDAAGASDMSDADLQQYLYGSGDKHIGAYAKGFNYSKPEGSKVLPDRFRLNNISTFYDTDMVPEESSRDWLRNTADSTPFNSYLGTSTVGKMLNTRKANKDFFVEHPYQAAAQTLIGKGSELLGVPVLDQAYQAKRAGLKPMGSWNPAPEGVGQMSPGDMGEYVGHAALDAATILPPGRAASIATLPLKAVSKVPVLKKLPLIEGAKKLGGKVFSEWGENSVPTIETIASNPSWKTTVTPTVYGGTSSKGFDKAARLLAPVEYGTTSGIAGWANTTPDADVDSRMLFKSDFGTDAAKSAITGSLTGVGLGFTGRLLAGKARAGGLTKEGVEAGSDLDKTISTYNKNLKEMDSQKKQSATFRKFENALDDPEFRAFMTERFTESPVYAPNANIYNGMLRRNDAFILNDKGGGVTPYPLARKEDPVQAFELGSGAAPEGQGVSGNLLQPVGPQFISDQSGYATLPGNEVRRRVDAYGDGSTLKDESGNWLFTDPETATYLEAAQKFPPYYRGRSIEAAIATPEKSGTVLTDAASSGFPVSVDRTDPTFGDQVNRGAYSRRLGISGMEPSWVSKQDEELANQGRLSFYSEPHPSILPDGDAARKLATQSKNLTLVPKNTDPSLAVTDDLDVISKQMFGKSYAKLTDADRNLIISNITLRDSPALMSNSARKVANEEFDRRNALADWTSVRKPALEKTVLDQYEQWKAKAKPSKSAQGTAALGFFVPGMISRNAINEPESDISFDTAVEGTPAAKYYYPETLNAPIIGKFKSPVSPAFYRNEALKLGGVGRYVIDPDWMLNTEAR